MRTAVVLAGGLGSRLRPYTVVLPKPLMPIGEMPILEVILRQLKAAGIERVVLAVNYQANIIKAFFENGERLGLDISYSLETEPLGTMGPLKLIDNLPEDFIVMNGDVLCDLDFSAFVKKHQADRAIFSISAAQRRQVVDYGVLERSNQGTLSGFTEKPTTNYLVSMGIYCLNRRILGWIPEKQNFGFDHLMHALLKANENVFVEPHDGYWLDIGRPDDYHQAVEDWPNLKQRLGI